MIWFIFPRFATTPNEKSPLFMRRFLILFFALLLFSFSLGKFPAYGGSDTDMRIRTALQAWVDSGDVVGVVVGVVTPQGQKIYSAGKTWREKGPKPDGNTIFEVGSITKVFTTLLFIDEITKGRMSLDDPVSMYLPMGMSFPKRGRPWFEFWMPPVMNKPVRLRHLAFHTSGFPRMPKVTDIPRGWKVNDPDYITVEMLKDYFDRFSFDIDPGARYEYSVVNTGVLGFAICNRENKDYESLLVERILEPMGLKDTRVVLSPSQKGRMAQGYGPQNQPVAATHMALSTAGSGSLKSTADDLVKFMSFSLGFHPCLLGDELKEAYQPRIQIDAKRQRALGYDYLQTPYGSMAYQDGKTLGFQSFISLFPEQKIGMVLLENSNRIPSQAQAGVIIDILMRNGADRKRF